MLFSVVASSDPSDVQVKYEGLEIPQSASGLRSLQRNFPSATRHRFVSILPRASMALSGEKATQVT
jgi:hypothetical protein